MHQCITRWSGDDVAPQMQVHKRNTRVFDKSSITLIWYIACTSVCKAYGIHQRYISVCCVQSANQTLRAQRLKHVRITYSRSTRLVIEKLGKWLITAFVRIFLFCLLSFSVFRLSIVFVILWRLQLVFLICVKCCRRPINPIILLQPETWD